MSKMPMVMESRASPPGSSFTLARLDGRDARRSTTLLFFVDEVSAAILLPAAFVRFGTEWLFFSVANRLDATAAYSGLDQRILYRIGTVGAQREVVFGGAALVRMAFDGYVDVGVLLQELGIDLYRTLLARAYLGLVVIEVDVFDVAREKFFLGCVGCALLHRRGVYGNACSGILTATGAFCDEMVGSRVNRGYLSRTALVDWANTFDGDVGRTGGLPGQRCGLAGLYCIWIR